MSLFVNRGDTLTVPAPAGGVVNGAGYLIGGVFGIATVSADEDDLFAFGVAGNWELPAATHATDQGFEPGDPVYYNLTSKLATKTSLGNLLIGAASAEKVSTADTIKVKLWPRAAAPHAALTKPAATAATNSTPYGFSQAQANAILVAVTALIDIAEQQGHSIPSA